MIPGRLAAKLLLDYSIYMATQTLNQLNGLPFANREFWPTLAENPWIFDVVYYALFPISSISTSGMA